MFTIKHSSDLGFKVEVSEAVCRRYDYFAPLVRTGQGFSEASNRSVEFSENQVPFDVIDVVFDDAHHSFLGRIMPSNFTRVIKALDYLCLKEERTWQNIANKCAPFLEDVTVFQQYLALCSETASALNMSSNVKFRTALATASLECPEAFGAFLKKNPQGAIKIVHKLCELVERGTVDFSTVTGERILCQFMTTQTLSEALSLIWRGASFVVHSNTVFSNPFSKPLFDLAPVSMPGAQVKFFVSKEPGKAAETGFKFKEFKEDFKGFDRNALPMTKDVKLFGFHLHQEQADMRVLRVFGAIATLIGGSTPPVEAPSQSQGLAHAYGHVNSGLCDCRTKYEDIALGLSSRTSGFYFYASMATKLQNVSDQDNVLDSLKLSFDVFAHPLRTLSLHLLRSVIGCSSHDLSIISAFSGALSTSQLAVHCHGLTDYWLGHPQCQSPLLLLSAWFSQCYEPMSVWHAARLIDALVPDRDGPAQGGAAARSQSSAYNVFRRHTTDTFRFIRDAKNWLPSEQYEVLKRRFEAYLDSSKEDAVKSLKRFLDEEPAQTAVRGVKRARHSV